MTRGEGGGAAGRVLTDDARADGDEVPAAAEEQATTTRPEGDERRRWWRGRRATRPGRPRWPFLGVVIGSVLLALTGGVLLYQAHELRTAPAADNRALTDVEATTRVDGDVSSALAKVFSYTPGGTDATERSARTVLSGRAARQYTQLFAQVRENVRSQRVTLTTQTVRVGTVSLRGDTAHLLVFLDQTARRGSKKPTTSAAQLSVTARLHDDVWQIVDIKAR
ncbi:hypothetical protein ACVHNB_32380 [Streptomyces sp. YJ-C3]